MNFDNVISSIWLYFLVLFSAFPSLCFLLGGEFEDFLKVFFSSYGAFLLASIVLGLLVIFVKGNLIDFYKLFL